MLLASSLNVRFFNLFDAFDFFYDVVVNGVIRTIHAVILDIYLCSVSSEVALL